MIKKDRIFITTTFLACETNSYQSTQLHNFFKLNGYKLVKMPSQADHIIITTCAFDQARENNSLEVIGRYAKIFGPKKKIIIYGCLPKINRSLEQKKGLILIGPKEINKFNALFRHLVPIEKVLANKLNTKFCSEEVRDEESDSFFIQICQGCVGQCSYCSIKQAKGFVASVPLTDILGQMKKGYRLGFRKFSLIGDDCGSYGIDIRTDFSELLNEFFRIFKKTDARLDIHYFEPARLIALYPKINKGIFKKIYQMNIPLQSASSRILRSMNRNYPVQDVLRIVKEIRSLNPDIFLETHIIFGFPGETRKDLADTFRLSEYFDRILYFHYTERKGTLAAQLSNSISRTEMMCRAWLIYKKKQKVPKIGLCVASITLSNFFESILKNNKKNDVDVLLIYPGDKKGTMHLPLSLLCIAGPLIEKGFNVNIIDERCEKDALSKIDKLIKKNKIICVGITCYTGPQIKNILRITRHIKSKYGVPIVLGGPHPTLLPAQTLEEGSIDIAVRGEGEETFPELVSALKNHKDLSAINGISFKTDGRIRHNRDNNLIRLDQFNDLPYYLLTEYLDQYGKDFSIQTSRGCSSFCAYCVIPLLNRRKYRHITPSNVIEQIQALQDFFGPQVKKITFLDEDFFAHRERTDRFLKILSYKLAHNKIQFFQWWVECRADKVLTLESKFINALIKNGLSSFYIGAESGSDRILSKINKKITRDAILKANRYLSQFDVAAEYSFMEGFSFESAQDRKDTYLLIKKMREENPRSRIWRINYYIPYPGTQLFQELRHAGKPSRFEDWSSENWYKNSILDIKYEHQLK